MVLSTPIPLDIVGTIIDELGNDSDTLKVTSLVSQSFLSFSQRRLFVKIHLKIGYRNYEDRRRARRLREVFSSNSILASYVRDFSLEIRDLWHPQTMTYPESINMSDNVLPNIIDALHYIRSLTLSGLWIPQTPTWKSAVLRLCASPRLSHICLTGIEKFPSNEIPKLRQLRRLSLQDTSLQSDGPDTPLTSGESSLDVLELDIESTGIHALWEMMMRPESPLGVSQLRVLRLTGTSHQMRTDIWEILQAVSGSLECFIWEHTFMPVIDLLIDSSHWAPYDMGPMNFGIVENLRFIAFSFTLNGPISHKNTRITWILNCLQHMGSRANRVEEFGLALFPNSSAPVTFSLEEWTASLDSILAGRDFRALTKLSIRLHSPHPDFLFPPNMDALVVDRFPLLNSAGKLSVESSCEEVHMPLFEEFIARTTQTHRM